MVSSSDQKTMLILGGSGFVSGTLAKLAVSRGWQVWTITRGQRAIPSDVHSIVVDRHQSGQLEEAVKQIGMHWDLIVDAIGYEPRDARQDIEFFSRFGNHLIFISTDFVYHPEFRQFPQDEEAGIYLSSGYGGKKRLCEIEFLRCYQADFHWSILRPCHIYGPGSQLGCLQNHARDPQLIRRLLTREPLKLVGGGHFLQQPIFAGDLAALILDMANNEATYGQIFCAAGPDIVESWKYYDIIAGILGVDLRIEEIPVNQFLKEHPEAQSYMCHRIYNLDKLRRAGIPLPSTSLVKGLREHVASLVSSGQR